MIHYHRKFKRNLLWNDTTPTTSEFTVGTSANVNENTSNFITYLWRSISGFSKVYSYTGNGNADGPFIYCGFRPRYVLIKRADVAGNWYCIDTSRYEYNNPTENYLTLNDANAETSSTIDLDIVSNGFKLRSTEPQINTNGSIFVGIAIAEQTEKWSNSR